MARWYINQKKVYVRGMDSIQEFPEGLQLDQIDPSGVPEHLQRALLTTAGFPSNYRLGIPISSSPVSTGVITSPDGAHSAPMMPKAHTIQVDKLVFWWDPIAGKVFARLLGMVVSDSGESEGWIVSRKSLWASPYPTSVWRYGTPLVDALWVYYHLNRPGGYGSRLHDLYGSDR